MMKGGLAATLFTNFLGGKLELVDDTDAQHVDVRLADIVAADAAIALPLSPHSKVAREVVLNPHSVGEIRVGVVSRHPNVGSAFRVGTIEAKLAVDGELVVYGEAADADEFESRSLDRRSHPTTPRLNFAEICIAELSAEIAVDLIPAKDLEGGIFVVAAYARPADAVARI